MASKRPTRVGRGFQSYLHFEGLLKPQDLSKLASAVKTKNAKKAMGEGALYDDVQTAGRNKDRDSRIIWLEREKHADADEPIIPESLHRKLR